MKIIKCLAGQMKDELCGAKEYIVLALEYRDLRPDLADTYYRMAQNEMTHYESLHSHAINIIQEQKNKNISIPQKMLNKWDEKHKELIEKQQEIQTYFSLYR